MKKFKIKVKGLWLVALDMKTEQFTFSKNEADGNTTNYHIIVDGICGLLLKQGFKANEITLHLQEDVV